MIQNLKNGLKLSILAFLISLLMGCATNEPIYITNVVVPELYKSEGDLGPYPDMPEKEDRTNGNMHLYRLRVEQWGCGAAYLFKQFVERTTDNKSTVQVPTDRCDVVNKEISQIVAASIKKT